MKRLTAAAAGVLSVFAIACGGSDSGSEPQQASVAPKEEMSSLSKDEFIAQADEICGEAGKKLKGIEAKFNAVTENNDYEGTAAIYEFAADNRADLMKDLKALGYDGEGSAAIDAYLDAFEEQLAQIRLLADALRDQDISEVSSYTGEIEKLGGKTEGLALGFGLKDCSFSE